MKKIFLIITILLSSQLAFAETRVVKRVISGDTIELLNGEKVYLIGVNAPENSVNETAEAFAERTGVPVERVTMAGKSAAQFLADLAEGKVVFLEYDKVKKGKSETTFAYVFLGYPSTYNFTPKDGYHYAKRGDTTFVFINATMIRSGYATPYNPPPNLKYFRLFKECFEDAKEKKRGLWQ